MQSTRIFPLSQFVHYDNFRHYYPFGNSSAEDFLQSVAVSECNKPAILTLGCGDMRFCMYTIWKNFGFEAENYNGFKGVDFVLNDRSAAILARNILFLYLCMCMPDEGDARKEWIASMWSLWYNHELQPQHDAMLSKALAQLIQWSCTWQEWSECRLGKVVKFSSPATFATVKKVWNKWHTHSMKLQSVQEMKSERNSFQCHHLSADKKNRREALQRVAHVEVNKLMLKSTFIIHPSERISRMEKDYLHYLMEGTVWAESVLGIPSTTTEMVINPTFFDRVDGKYTLHYTLTPYIGFIQTFQYTHAEVNRSLGKECSLLQFLPVADHHFDTVPLLANSVQQFSMWLVATAHMIKKPSGSKVSFTFDLDDAINLCYSLFHQPKNYSKLGVKLVKFDAIYTSNLLDHISPPSLVLSALPLLKSTGILFTDTFRYKVTASSTGEFLEKTFGISSELFPVLLGIHCLGHDGKYSSAVNLELNPDFLFSDRKTLLWRNVVSQSFVIESLEESLHTTEHLLNMCTSVSYIESFLILLHQFIEQFQPRSSCSHLLEQLGTAIRNNFRLQSHLIQLQTQSLLHGIHMHITLTDEDCPLCRGQSLESYIQQFTVSFDIHSKVSTYEAPIFKIWLFSESSDVAIVTSVGGRSSGSTVILDFFLPKQCCSRYSKFEVTMKTNENEQECASGSVCDLRHSTTEYLHLKKCVPHTTEKLAHTCTLGNIVKHIGNECTFETVISMNTPCQRAMESSKLNAKCVESNQLKLSCGTLTDVIVYPYTIDESKVHIKLSKKRNLISITATRDCNILHKEKPTFYVDSSNKLSLPQFRCSSNAMENYCAFQSYTNPPGHPLFNAKRTFTELFSNTLNGEKYFTLAFPSKRIIGSPDVYGLVCVHDVRFSVAFSSPVLDVSYCFLDTKPKHLLVNFEAMCRQIGPTRSIWVDDVEYKLLKEIFRYFSSTTYHAFSRDRHTVSLPQEENQLWKHFDHAVLFPLYPNPENEKFHQFSKSVAASVTRQGATDEQLAQLGLGSRDKCSFCGQASATLKNCTRCRQAKYCGRECQEMHWKMHKLVCNAANKNPQKQKSTSTEDEPSTSSLTTNNQSSDSNKASKNRSEEVQYKPSKNVPTQTEVTGSPVCMRCKKPAHIHCSCGSVSYCSKECQRLELPDHSKKCSQLKDNSSTSELPRTSPASKAQGCGDYPEIVPTSIASSRCAHCTKTKSSLKRCKCRSVSYCSVECQRLHWPQHKSTCSAIIRK